MKHIVVTWPKGRTLESYLTELERASGLDQEINFRVPFLPNPPPGRCYRVHDGAIRGWTPVIAMRNLPDNTVLDPITGNYWPAGFYVVCEPEFHRLATPVPLRGFQGWRWLDISADRRLQVEVTE